MVNSQVFSYIFYYFSVVGGHGGFFFHLSYTAPSCCAFLNLAGEVPNCFLNT